MPDSSATIKSLSVPRSTCSTASFSVSSGFNTVKRVIMASRMEYFPIRASCIHHIFRVCSKVNKDSDQDQKDVVEQPDREEEEGQKLAEAGGHTGGTNTSESYRKQSSQNPPAIQRKCRQQIEHRQCTVGYEQVEQNGLTSDGDKVSLQGLCGLCIRNDQASFGQNQPEKQSDNQVDSWPCGGDHELGFGIFRDLIQAGNAAYGQQRDTSGADIESFFSERMTKFVQNNADEQQQDKKNTPPHLFNGSTPGEKNSHYEQDQEIGRAHV